ncbi:helix-turn-helix domain-containing protein [Sphingomonas crocodyli]|nr:helix-turn-helix domain-containing protein [Sphingomonas crocodyli]
MSEEVATLRKGLRLLLLINQYDGLTAGEAATHLDLNRTTTYRLLETMVDTGHIARDPYDHRYRATARAERLSLPDGEAEGWHADAIRPVLAGLGQRIAWPLSIATLDGDAIRIVHETDSDSALVTRRMPSGTRLPLLDTAAGLLFTAHASPDRRGELLARARSSLLTQPMNAGATLSELCDQIASDGYALVRQPASGTYVLAVPMIVDGAMTASLSVRIIERAMTAMSAIAAYLPLLREGADAIASAIRTPPADRVAGASARR